MKQSLVARDPMRNIVRYPYNGTTSWVVCFKRAGKKYIKFFADGDEGKAASLKRAQTWRDAMEEKLGPWNKLHRRSSTNTSGVIGVSLIKDRTRVGTIVRRWVAHWHSADGIRLKKSFSVLLYGDAEARRRAIAVRRQGVADFLAARAAQ